MNHGVEADIIDQGAARSGFAISRLNVTDFRCYQSAGLNFGAGINVIVGANGAGKTNILEAVSLLAPGRGLRNAALPDFARVQGDGNWAVFAEVDADHGKVKIGTGRTADAASGTRREVRVDGQPRSSATSLGELLSVLWVTPSMDRLFVEAPSGRRRFLDRMVLAFDPAHAARVGGYERAMRDRTRLLKDGTADHVWLAALEATMAEQGVAVAAARQDVAERLGAAMAHAQAAFPPAAIVLEGLVEQGLAQGHAAVDLEDELAARLAAGRNRDKEAGRALNGPHTSDMLVTHLGKNMPADQCSTGEQKSLLLALIVAQARLIAWARGRAPILLLDEIGAHLDEARRDALFAALDELKAQCLLTGTDQNVFASLHGCGSFFEISDGVIAPQG